MKKRLIVYVVSAIGMYLMQLILPWVLKYVDNIPFVEEILAMKPRYVVLWIIIMFIYEYYERLRGKGELLVTLDSKVKDLRSKSLSDCFINFVTIDSDDIAAHFKQITAQPIDLAWEPKMLGLRKCSRDGCQKWKSDKLTQKLSVIRRNRMETISTSLLGWKVNMCYAMECHLYNIISDKKKYINDKEYRKKQMSKINHWFNLFLKKIDCRRIVVIRKENWNNLINNKMLKKKLKEYLSWHVKNHWEMQLFIVDDSVTDFKLSVLGQIIPNANYDDLTDFIIIGKRWDKEIIVFAQDNKELAQIIKDKAIQFKEWYKRAWDNGLVCNIIERHIVNNDFTNDL